jgi:hypothetical protein
MFSVFLFSNDTSNTQRLLYWTPHHSYHSYYLVTPLSADVSLLLGVELLDPASHDAASKFCNGFAACPLVIDDVFCRSSNSARISGSTAKYVSILFVRKEDLGNLLLSIRYGIPKTMIILTPAMRIIGFLSRLKGETISRC